MTRLTAAAAALLLLVAGCAEDNPFTADAEHGWQGRTDHPHIVAVGTQSGGLGVQELSDLDPETAGVQDAILLRFDQAMDEATVTATAFDLIETFPEGGPVQLDTVYYEPETMTAVLSGTFTEKTAYLLTVTAGAVLDLNGNQLDPNRNAEYDGEPWDNTLLTFWNGEVQVADIVPPGLNGHFPAGGGVTAPRPDITAVFALGPMDVSLLNLQNVTLTRVVDSLQIQVEIIEATGDRVVVRPVADLQPGRRYCVRLSSALADSSGNYLDTNGDRHIWPDEPDYTWDLQMADDSTTNLTPPTVARISRTGALVEIRFEESLTGDYVAMEDSTLNTRNIQLMDSLGAVPLSVEPGPMPDMARCLMQREMVGDGVLHVSANVADRYGNLLDGNNDGLGGTPGEDDWSGEIASE